MSSPVLLSINVPNALSSHWLEILGSHVIPSPSDVDHIRNAISVGESDLCHLEVEITRVQALLRRLRLRCEKMGVKISEHKALLSPVRRLPDELLSKIFVHCLPQRRSFRRNEAPLLLGFVCSHWRAVSFSTPELWSSVQVNFSTRTIESATAKAKIWLERAGTRPLSVMLCEQRRTAPNRRIQGMINFLLSISQRCHHILLDVQEDLLEALSPMKEHFTSLHSVTITGYTHNDFEIAPNLHKVHLALKSLFIHWSISDWLKLPYSQLTEFTANWILVRDCFQILASCPNLISCTLGRVSDDASSSFLPLQHSRLRNLRISGNGDVGDIFNCLTLPALRAVELFHEPRRGKMLTAKFLNLLSRSSCVLERFFWDVEFGLYGPLVLLRYLQADSMQNLKDLQILGAPGRLIPHLSPDSRGKYLCPKL